MGTLKSHALPDMPSTRTRPGAKARGRPLRPLRKRWSLAAWIALIPMMATVIFAYLGTMLWTARVSVSNSRTFPSNDFVGFTQYVRLFNNDRWLVSLQHIVLYGASFFVGGVVFGL